MSTAVIIARFQTPYLHEGHVNLIDTVRGKHNKLVIILGVSPVQGTRRNPYDYYTREKMIKSAYPGVVVLPHHDHPSDEVWSAHLDQLLSSTFPSEKFTLYGSRDSFIAFYHGGFETQELPAHGDHNSTEIRNMYADKVFDSNDFRAGILYALHNQYVKVYPTVDVIVFRNNRTELLLGKKAINNLWRLIGGFSDPTDDNYEAAARRELMEEAGEITVGEMSYETSQRINDWRYRSEEDKIMTMVFSCDYISGEPKAQDDIVALDWFKIAQIPSLLKDELISHEHVDLFNYILKKYNS